MRKRWWAAIAVAVIGVGTGAFLLKPVAGPARELDLVGDVTRGDYLIRLGGCDVGCHWCDVKESWDKEAHPGRSVEDIVAEAVKHPARIAVVTGGEPLMHDLGPLTEALEAEGFRESALYDATYQRRFRGRDI